MSRGWYVLSVYSGYENKVERFLRQMIDSGEYAGCLLDIKVPTEEVVEVVNGKKRVSQRKFLPGYILLDMDMPESNWKPVCSAIRKIGGVTGFIGHSESMRPHPIGNEEAKAMLQKAGDLKVERTVRLKQDFHLGEKVRIVDGPFVSFVGSVEEVHQDRSKLRVVVPIFGRDTPVELDFFQVERL